ncbi:MAG: hypothetical protein DMG65_23765 [Candidatus Angelobacter sp. Gp1-AA117]|nr:MAG: hypothetical protein DMG65_23765 [Candidatus Angelobacter sp. Gp1-AA117]
MTRQTQGTTLFTALLVLIGIGVVVQLWLLAASVDAVLRHNVQIPLHAALGSVIVFLINGGLVMYVFWFDKRIKQ